MIHLFENVFPAVRFKKESDHKSHSLGDRTKWLLYVS